MRDRSETDFWADAPDDWVDEIPPWHEYVGPELTTELVREAEQALGYKLPESYLGLLRIQNGGLPKRRCLQGSWGQFEITGLFGIGGFYGIDSPERGSRFMIGEWGYPDVGVVIAPTPSGGHDAIMLDYSVCGRDGEPRVIRVETEGGKPEIAILAADFASFVDTLEMCPE